jgi:hypothetical protein
VRTPKSKNSWKLLKASKIKKLSKIPKTKHLQNQKVLKAYEKFIKTYNSQNLHFYNQMFPKIKHFWNQKFLKQKAPKTKFSSWNQNLQKSKACKNLLKITKKVFAQTS